MSLTLHARRFPSCLLAMLLLAPAISFAQGVSFENDVRPIFEQHCVRCHREGKDEGGMRMDMADEVLRYVTDGDLENSDLYLHLLGEDLDIMPPEEEEDSPLPAEKVETIKNWILSGATWPDGMVLTSAQEDAPSEDAAADPAEEKTDDTIFRAIGSLHPAAIHLPIGLLLGAGLFSLLSLRGNFVMSDCAYYCLWLGTIGAIIACVTGWWFPMLTNHADEMVNDVNSLMDQKHELFWHRTSALICTAVGLLLALFAASARARDPEDGIVWKLGCIALAAGIAWTGHLGGELTHGERLYKDLNKLISDFTAPAEPGAEEVGGTVGDASDESNGDASEEAGSDESDDEVSDRRFRNDREAIRLATAEAQNSDRHVLS